MMTYRVQVTLADGRRRAPLIQATDEQEAQRRAECLTFGKERDVAVAAVGEAVPEVTRGKP